MLYDEKEVLSLWEKVQSEPTFSQTQTPGLTGGGSLGNGTLLNFLPVIEKCCKNLR